MNGELRREGNTDEMIWGVSYLLADLARTITLLPGDLILTGTPATPAPWYLATWSQVRWKALGKLTNTVAEVGVLTRLLDLNQPVPKKRSPPL